MAGTSEHRNGPKSSAPFQETMSRLAATSNYKLVILCLKLNLSHARSPAISESGMVANVGVAVKMALPSLSVISSSGLVTPVLNFSSPSTSGIVDNASFKSGKVKNMVLAVKITSAFLSVQKLLIL